LVEVEETRLLGNLSRSWALSDKTNIQASVGAEFSVIDVPTSGEDSRSFFRPKGLLSASHKLNESWTVRGQVERKVGQLNFGTFVSSVSLTNDTETQGNDEIFPEQSWEAELEIQKQDTTGLSGRATVFYELIEDPITQLFSFDENNELVQGPGNLDSNAQVFGAVSPIVSLKMLSHWTIEAVAEACYGNMKSEPDGILRIRPSPLKPRLNKAGSLTTSVLMNSLMMCSFGQKFRPHSFIKTFSECNGRSGFKILPILNSAASGSFSTKRAMGI